MDIPNESKPFPGVLRHSVRQELAKVIGADAMISMHLNYEHYKRERLIR